MRQEQKRLGQFDTAHFQRTIMKVILQNRCNIIMKIAEGFHQPGNSGVAGGMLKLRARHDGIVGNILLATEQTDNFEHSLTRRAQAALQHIAHHQRPGIDKGVTRLSVFNFQLKQ
jgi:hypothetical protein